MSNEIALTLEQLRQTSGWAWVATVFGVAEVLLARRNSIWLYPAGIVATLAGTYVLLDPARLYAEALLNVYYFAMSVYGWFHWSRRHGAAPLPVSRATPAEWSVTLAIVLAGWAVLYMWLSRLTDSTVPAWDAFVSASAWAGTWLLARRKIENWIVLNVSNAVAIPLLMSKQLPLFALLTLFLFVVAVVGYFDWRRLLASTDAAPIPTSRS